MRIPAILSLGLALLFAPSSRAEMIYTAPPEVVAAHAEIVVRARVDLETRTAEILSCHRGDVNGAIEIRNLRDFADTEALPGALSPTDEAILFLDELDGRYYLVHTSSPAWIRPHAALLYLTPEGKVLEYGQFLSGVLQLSERKGTTRRTLEESLEAWLREPRPVRHERPSLGARDAERLHGLVDPFVDLHRREVVVEPNRDQLGRMLDGLQALAADSEGELGRRAIESMLVLGQQVGSDQNRRGLVEMRLVALLERIGAEPFVEPCLDEVRSPAVSASRRTAAKLLRQIGGAPQAEAKQALLDILAEDRSTLGTEAYFALRDLGFPVAAENALRPDPQQER